MNRLPHPSGPIPLPRYHFSLATPDDEAGLRRLLREMEMPGSVRLTYEREPDYFAADAPLGETVQTLVARQRPNGPPVAVTARTTRTVFLQGVPTRIGYLSGLRVVPEHRNAALTGGAWSAFRAMNEADPVPFTLASITADNDRARRFFSLKRGDAPTFEPLAQLVTLALIVRRQRADSQPDPDGARGLRERLGSTRDLFPALAPVLPGASGEGEIVVRRDGQPVAATTLWDPRTVKQSVVRGYTGALGRWRPLANAVLRVAGAQALPPIGQALAAGFAVQTVAQDDEAYRMLLDATLAAARQRGLACVLVAHDEMDPRLSIARRFLHVPYRSTLYAAHWPDGHVPDLRAPLHAEIATY